MAIVDSDTIENFISPSLTNKNGYFIWIKKGTYNLMVIDKNPLVSQNGKVNEITELLPVST